MKKLILTTLLLQGCLMRPTVEIEDMVGQYRLSYQTEGVEIPILFDFEIERKALNYCKSINHNFTQQLKVKKNYICLEDFTSYDKTKTCKKHQEEYYFQCL